MKTLFTEEERSGLQFLSEGWKRIASSESPLGEALNPLVEDAADKGARAAMQSLLGTKDPKKTAGGIHMYASMTAALFNGFRGVIARVVEKNGSTIAKTRTKAKGK